VYFLQTGCEQRVRSIEIALEVHCGAVLVVSVKAVFGPGIHQGRLKAFSGTLIERVQVFADVGRAKVPQQGAGDKVVLPRFALGGCHS
jgi:hypothetical protein